MLPDMAGRIARAALQDGSSLPRLAVLPCHVFSGGRDQRDAELLAQLVATDLANSGAYAVFPRTTAIEKVMEEHQIERSGMTDPESIRAIGEAVNARYVLSANVRKLGTDNLFTASILHIVEASQGQGAWERYQTVQDGIEIMPRLARSLTGVQAAAPSQTPADPEVPESAWTPSGDFELALAGDFLTITGYKGTAAVVNIPARIDGIPVQAIGNEAFSYCRSLTSITIPNGVVSIGDWAFTACSSLTSITIPNSVVSIGVYAFTGCNSLKDITVASGNTQYRSVNGILFSGDTVVCYPAGKTYGSYVIPNSVTSIGYSAFSDCSSLTSITIPNSVTSIGDGAFAGCSSLTSVTIPNSVTSIGDSAFSSCSSLTSVTIPNGVTSIGDRAFAGCSSLTSITIPNSVTSIGDYAFYSCDSLTSITIPHSVTSIGERAFSSCSSLRDITVASGNTQYRSINGILFRGDTIVCYPAGKTYGSYVIPNSVTSIGYSAFYGCSSLASITIPNSVTSIGDWAFYDCSSLTSITIPNSVTSIGGSAFYGCDNLSAGDREAIRRRFGDGVF
jgi:hypothetical protein